MLYERCRIAGDYPFRIRSNIRGAGRVLDRLLGSFTEVVDAEGLATYTLSQEGSGASRFVLTLDGGFVQRVEAAGSMLDWLFVDITRKAVRQTEGYLAIHAGVVAMREQAILLPAAPDSGKTTTVAGLIRSGFSYLSDEVAFLALADECVYPFPRPLVMDERSIHALVGIRDELPAAYEPFRNNWYHVAPDDIRKDSTGGVAAPACVISPRYEYGSVTRIRPMTGAETLFLLAENTFNLASTGAEGFALLRALVHRVPGYRLEIGDLGDAIGVISEVLARLAPEASIAGA